jgi:hypothetical protein
VRIRLLFLSFVLCVGLVVPNRADAGLEPVTDNLTRALEARLTVWRTPAGRRIYVSHCRTFRGGCESRIASFARMIADVADRHDIDPFLLAAIALKESGLNPAAVGLAGERGIVQLHPLGAGRNVRYVQQERYRNRCVREPDACQAEVLEIGARLLSSSIARCGGLEAGLGMYNAGRCSDTLPYVARVLRERDRLVELAVPAETESEEPTTGSPTPARGPATAPENES